MNINQINKEQLQEKMQSNNVLLLDVRSEIEYSQGTIDKSINIPLNLLIDNIDQIDPNQEIIVFCAHGVRSMQAAKILQNHGFLNVFNLTGGIF